MFLGLLAIEGIGHAALVQIRERYGCGGDEGNALVGGTEEHVELDSRLDERGCVAAPQERRRLPVAEESRIEEVGALASGFQCELSETQSIARERKVDERQLIILHGASPARATAP